MEPTTTPAAEPAPIPPIDPTAFPELGDRYRALTIDVIVIIALMFVAMFVFESWPNAPEKARMWAFILIWAGYEPLAITFGCTLGNYVMKIRVRKASDEKRRISIIQAYVRFAVKTALGWLSFLTITSNPKRRAIHDMVAGSVMVKHVPAKP